MHYLVSVKDFFTVFGGGQSGVLAEAFPKVIAVIVAHGGRNVIDFIARVGEQMFGFFHPKFRDVLVERSARLRFKVGADVGGGQIDAGADIFYRKRGIA